MSFANDDNIVAKTVAVSGSDGSRIDAFTQTSGGFTNAVLNFTLAKFADGYQAARTLVGRIRMTGVGNGGGSHYARMELVSPGYASDAFILIDGSSGEAAPADDSSINVTSHFVDIGNGSSQIILDGDVQVTGLLPGADFNYVDSVTQVTGIGTSETVTLILPSKTYPANSKFSVYLRGGVSSTTAGEYAYGILRKGPSGSPGQVLGEFLRTPIPTVSDVYDKAGRIEFITGASAVTSQIVLTLRAKAATINHFGNATAIRSLTVKYEGPAPSGTNLLTLV